MLLFLFITNNLSIIIKPNKAVHILLIEKSRSFVSLDVVDRDCSSQMSNSDTRLRRQAFVSLGALFFLSFLYSVFLLHPLYKQHLSKILELPKPTYRPEAPSPLPEKESTEVLYTGLKDGKEETLSDLSSRPSDSPVANTSASSLTWHFNTTRDANTYVLSADQCDTAFHGLFDDIERAAAYRKRIGSYELDDIDISWTQYGAVRAAILNQQVMLYACSLRSSQNPM